MKARSCCPLRRKHMQKYRSCLLGPSCQAAAETATHHMHNPRARASRSQFACVACLLAGWLLACCTTSLCHAEPVIWKLRPSRKQQINPKSTDCFGSSQIASLSHHLHVVKCLVLVFYFAIPTSSREYDCFSQHQHVFKQMQFAGVEPTGTCGEWVGIRIVERELMQDACAGFNPLLAASSARSCGETS